FYAKGVADNRFADYTFADNTEYGFGDRYSIYNTDNDFQTIMEDYCNCQNDNSRAYLLKHAPEELFPEELFPEEEKMESSLTVYPNPATTVVNFTLFSEESGDARIGLYDLAGQNLISTTDRLNGNDELFGKINIGTLDQGVYFVIVNLPNGETISQRIIKN
ncbi:MAG: T9SS type A sorting domain-containing protein, partial [Bacteroidales bacterium]|nr:T9SS type A sorting domain-containing protein [Bacteroidales bacterium]